MTDANTAPAFRPYDLYAIPDDFAFKTRFLIYFIRPSVRPAGRERSPRCATVLVYTRDVART